MTQQPTRQSSIDTAPADVRHDVTVSVPRAHAFRVFTEQFDLVKPREHNLLDVAIARTVLEPRVGGSVYDIGVDGSQCHWARVLAFEPPERLVLAWQIGADWELETDPARASEVEIRFVAVGPQQTRVELRHRHLERHGEGWEHARAALDGANGWPLYVARFVDLLGVG